jgi:serralysin
MEDNDTLQGGGGNDTLWGEAGNDDLNSGIGADSVLGGDGSDAAYLDSGNDYYDGGNGTDFVSYSFNQSLGAASGVSVNLSTNSASNDGFGFADTLYNVENIGGSTRADTLIGNSGTNFINGLADNDVLQGLAGNDTLWGEAGDDTLTGGLGIDSILGGDGADIFYFTALSDSTSTARDIYTDFTPTQLDKFDVSALGYTAITSGSGSGTTLGYSFVGTETIVTSGDGSDFSFKFSGNIDLNSTNFTFA